MSIKDKIHSIFAGFSKKNSISAEEFVRLMSLASSEEESLALIRSIPKGSDIIASKTGYVQCTYFHQSAFGGNYRLTKAFIDQGIDIEITDKDKNTALHYVCRKGQEEVAKLLIENGANINAKGKWGRTPLIYAITESDSDQLIKYLISKGADINLKDDDGADALYYCKKYRSPEMIRLIEQNMPHTELKSSSEIFKKILVFLNEQEGVLDSGSIDDLREGHKSFASWGKGIVIGSREWILGKLSQNLEDIDARSIWSKECTNKPQFPKLIGYTVNFFVSLPSDMLAGFYYAKLENGLYALFGYNFNHDQRED